MTIRVGVRKPFRLLAPAKLNLGLEILGKRPDSYHEIVTILQTIDFGDEIVLEPATALDYRPPTEIEDDLTARALRLLAGHGVEIRARIRLSKRIPIAAGLGGGSSDAGTLLGALVHAGLPYSLARRIASDLGCDVPFFLGGGTALATDRGTELEPLSSPTGWFVIVVPPLSLRNKTRTLYSSLTPADYSDGTATRRQAEHLRQYHVLDPHLIRNAFLRPLLAFPQVRLALDDMRAAGAQWAWPSGSGPALFTWSPQQSQAEEIAVLLRARGWEPIVAAPYRPTWHEALASLALG